MDLEEARIEVPNGILGASSEEFIKIVHAYMKAKGLRIQARELDVEASRFCAGLEHLLIQAEKFRDKPTITTKKRTSTSDNETSTRVWQEGKGSEYLSDGTVVIKAEDYIRMVAPVIEGAKGTWIDSPDTLIL